MFLKALRFWVRRVPYLLLGRTWLLRFDSWSVAGYVTLGSFSTSLCSYFYCESEAIRHLLIELLQELKERTLSGRKQVPCVNSN